MLSTSNYPTLLIIVLNKKIKIMNATPFNQNFFNNIATDFDKHVRQSIPLYKEYFNSLIDALTENNKIYEVLDLCGSTGELGRRIALNGFRGNYTNVDGSPQMIACGNYLNTTNNIKSDRIKNCLCGFMNSWTDESGITIPLFTSRCKYDVCIENLGFQFFTRTRNKEVKEVKSLLKNNGIFVTCEKLKRSPEMWNACEILKDTLHKSKSFTAKQITDKKEKVLNAMGDYLVTQDSYEEVLGKHFNYVTRIYQSGNFAGYICSDSKKRIEQFEKHFGKELLNNKFNPF